MGYKASTFCPIPRHFFRVSNIVFKNITPSNMRKVQNSKSKKMKLHVDPLVTHILQIMLTGLPGGVALHGVGTQLLVVWTWARSS